MRYPEDLNRSKRIQAQEQEQEQEQALEKDYRELLDPHIEQWDQSITPPNPPSLATLTALAREHNKALRQRYWKELALLWLIGALVLSGLLLLWQSSIILFAIVQGTALVAAIAFLAVSGINRRERRRRQWQE
ncbi:DUF5345 family protein [Paenibacillus sp. OV219]|uniref:DUF5345 family protein n=1 Tax=Paenibacillus sp. OV219 TaxID=1884377 RepID=UPI0008C9F04F|nr:DUF5345 family protein [Paenibacillus sp. OV219]SEO68495.1 hypothetical protein SAMN05518847_109236 [Paenibacillus sp. OV219]